MTNSTGSRAWRLIPQLYHLNKEHKWDVEVRPGFKPYPYEELLKKVDKCDVLLYQSVFDQKLVDYAKEKGKKIIFEFDDLLHIVPDNHPEQSKISHKAFQDGVENIVKIADVCITTNEFLKNQYTHWNENIHVFPNYMDFEFWQKPERSRLKTDKIRLGWAGGISHVDDLKFITPVLVDLCKKYENLQIVYCGGGGPPGDDAWRAFNYGPDIMKEIPYKNREYSLGTPLEYWPDKLNSLQFDIGIAPLIEHKFNRCKTPIKWMEYGINKVPSVCQEFLYGQVIEDGVTGFTATDEQEWFEKLSKLIEDENLRKEMGTRAKESVIKNHNMDDHLEEWVDIIINK